MKNKKGFISISIIYSFFVVFLLFLVLIMSSYINNRFNFNLYKNDIKKKFVTSSSIVGNSEFLNDHIKSLENSEDYISSQDNTIYRVVNQNGIRYEGVDPDNYITFNNEQWRIVGSFKGSELGLDADKYYTKIVRSNSIGKYAWDDDGNNDWATSSLREHLEIEFYDSLPGEYRNMLAMPEWYYSKVETDTYTLEIYEQEREDFEAIVGGYVGLLYPSDYGYSAYSNTCDNLDTSTLYWYESYDEQSCSMSSWVYKIFKQNCNVYLCYYWLLNPGVKNDWETNRVTAITSWGWVTDDLSPKDDYYDYYDYIVHPTVYLDSNVYIESGTGTKLDPYKIAL